MTAKAGFSIKVFNLKKEENCIVCPKKTTTAFALFKQSQLVAAAKCDSAFCLLATQNTYFLEGGSEPVIANWIDKRIKGKIEKAEKSGAQDQAIHQCKEAVGQATAMDSIKEEIKSCLSRGASGCLQEFLNVLTNSQVVEYHSKANEIAEDKWKDLPDLGVTRNALKCGSCAEETCIAITGVSANCLVGTRYQAHCDKLKCLVDVLAKNANMTPSANPKLVEQSAAERGFIDETKAKELHRLIFLGQELIKVSNDSVATARTEKQRSNLARQYSEKVEGDDVFGTNESILNRKQLLDNSWLKSKILPRRLDAEAKEMKAEIDREISNLNGSIPEDKSFAQNQQKVSKISKELAEIDAKIEALKSQANAKKQERSQEIREHEVEGLQIYQTLLEAKPFEKIAKIAGMLYSYRKKLQDLEIAKMELGRTQESFARFFEEILEIEQSQRLPAHKFEAVINIEQEHDGKVFSALKEVIERCDQMQKQAKEVEKESWNKWYQHASESRELNHATMTEKAAEIQKRNKELVKANEELESHALFEKIAMENMTRDSNIEKNRLEAVIVDKEQRIQFFKEQQEDAFKEVEKLKKRFEELKAKYEHSGEKGNGWTEVVGRTARGTGGGEGRGGCRSAASSSVGSRPPPQFLNQTQPFCSNSSSSASANPQQLRGMLEDGYSDQPVRKSHEQENRERDERQ